DRQDPEKSTEAALRFLKSLYKRYGDWELAMAAYNCGPGNVNKAIRRSGGKRTFWEIYNYLPRETRSYIPQFQAIMYVMRHSEHHNLYLED
ncbi:transglycosylase SLT domain-containing protein, partial [Klebsiella pneumoniae]|uniref:transglycosylase SLT domain-containing protein n=1 Tax=Klebsiella pneumoniae TaxID=573 RepID=UPI0027314552